MFTGVHGSGRRIGKGDGYGHNAACRGGRKVRGYRAVGLDVVGAGLGI